jgi:hypothetical protein
VMHMGNLKAVGLAIAVALAASALVACGSGDGGTATQEAALSATTASRLATLSDRVASQLDAGETCHAAHSADDLQSAVQSANLPQSIRSGVDGVAGRLVEQVNCPPPPPPPPKDEHKHKDEHQQNQDQNGPPEHGGKLPPGQAKLKGEG